MQSTNPKIVAIFGCDGSGKSMHISLLNSYLKNHGVKVHKAWICSHHLFAWLLCRIFVRLGRYVWRPSEKFLLEKYPSPEVLKSRLARRIWLFSEIISTLLIILMRVRLPKLLGYAVIVERYIAGTLADFVYMFGNSFLNSLTARLLLKLANNNDTLFLYLDANYETIIKRREFRAEPEDYIETQTIVYSWFAKYHDCLIVDTATSDIETTHKLIREYVSDRISNPCP